MRSAIQVGLFFILCLSSVAQTTRLPAYSFFTAGHTYGSPGGTNLGLHPPFMQHIPDLNNMAMLELGFLTGDVVRNSTAQNWDSAQADMGKIHVPVFVAAGNHDMGEEFLLRFGSYYSSFKHDSDLFIILTPGLDNWNISGAQKDFLVNTLDLFAPQSRHIFIILHELIWWSPDSIFRNVQINYLGHYPGSTNFWDEIEPLLHPLPNEVVLFAGDLGCTDQVTPFMYFRYDNITLIASGMGGGVRDNMIITDVYPDTLVYRLYALNGDDPDKLGKLTDFSLFPSGIKESMDTALELIPNPASDRLVIRHYLAPENTLEIINLHGETLLTRKHINNRESIDISQLPPGLLLIRFSAKEGSHTRKLIKQ